MRALLVNPPSEIGSFSFPEALNLIGKKAFCLPLGLLTVAAMLPKDWELRVVDLCARKLPEDYWSWADIVMLSGNVHHRTGFLDLVRQAKQKGKTVVAGGPYASMYSDEVMASGVDFLIKGEAEDTMPLFLDALKEGRKGGIFSTDEKPDLAKSPIPRFDLVNLSDYAHVQIQTSRGCPFECEFCDIIVLYGRVPRYKTPDQVIAELDTLYLLGWRGFVMVADDNFVGSKKRARTILTEMIKWQTQRGSPFAFFTQASVNLGQDMEMVDLMTAANFGNVFIGAESPDEDVLTLTGKTQNVRNPLAESLKNINKNGLPIVASFVVGFDGEKPGVGQRIVALVEQTAIPVAVVNTLWAFPHTALWKRLEQEGRLSGEVMAGEDLARGTFNFVPSRPEAEVLEDFIYVWDQLHQPSHYLGRVYRYYLAMRPTRRAIAKSNKQPLPPASAPLSLRERLVQLRGFVQLVWLLGIRLDCRLQFWKQLFGMWRQNPSRLEQYIGTLGFGPDMFRIREKVLGLRNGNKSTGH